MGFLMGEAVGTVSGQYPNVHFAIMNGFLPVQRSNVEIVLYKEQEAGALFGVVAGMLENNGRSPKPKNVIGTIGGFNFPSVNA